MRESYMRTDKMIVVGLWLAVLGVAVATSVRVLMGAATDAQVRTAIMALMPLTGLAVTLHIRLYAVRMCSMIRATAGLDRGGQVHAMSDHTLHRS
jgi:predicted ferric reductase